MNWKNSTERYGSVSIALHWLMVGLIAAVYACIQLHEVFDWGSALGEFFKTWHFMLGLSVFALVWLRLIVRLSQVTPRIEPELARWQHVSAKIVHVGLYGLMIGMPFAGWLMLSAAGKPIPFFGLGLPALIAKNEDLAYMIMEVHEAVGTAGYFLIGLHAAAALFHHYIQKDNTLVRMLPRLK